MVVVIGTDSGLAADSEDLDGRGGGDFDRTRADLVAVAGCELMLANEVDWAACAAVVEGPFGFASSSSAMPAACPRRKGFYEDHHSRAGSGLIADTGLHVTACNARSKITRTSGPR